VLGERVEVRPKRGQRSPLFARSGVLDEVERARLPVRDAGTVRERDVRLVDAPLLRRIPVQDGHPAKHLVDLKRDALPNSVERLAEAVAGDGAAVWENLLDEREERVGAGGGGVGDGRETGVTREVSARDAAN